MADVNTVVIVSNKQEIINHISQKLVLLRDLDKIKSCSIQEVQTMLDGFNPNVLILHCENNNQSVVELIKNLKNHELYKNLPILLINENCSRETIIEAFDNGISDVLFMPIIDYELLIRVIWALKKNEMNLCIESQKQFLSTIGVVESESDVYCQKYCYDFLKNEIEQTKKYSQRACLLIVSPDKKYPNNKTDKEFIRIIKKAIRLNDSVVQKNSRQFYVYLKKTKLNGAYSVFERINNSLGIEAGANAGVVEIQKQRFDDIIEALDAALEKANENTNSLIVASDFYYSSDEPQLVFDDAIKKTNNDIPHLKKTPIEPKIDDNSIKLYNQAYARKLKIVVVPVFKKFENSIRTKHQDFAVKSYVGQKSLFAIAKKDISATFALDYDGAQQVSVKLTILDNAQKRLFETETVDFNVLDSKKLSLMLSGLSEKFIAIANRP